MLFCAFAYNLLFKLQHVPLNPLNGRLFDPLTVWVWGSDGILYGVILVAVWWLATKQWNAIATTLLFGSAAGMLAPYAWHSWNEIQYPASLYARFAVWRAQIPLTGQGMFPRNPMGAWYLLERSSYYSPHQVAGDIFSRAKAVEIRRRARLITQVVQSEQGDLPTENVPPPRMLVSADAKSLPTAPVLTEKSLALLCADPALDFYVTQNRLNLPEAAAAIVPNANKPLNQFHLYRCADIGRSQSTSRSAPVPP